MEIKDFDRRFHKKVFLNRLGIGIYSLIVPILIFVIFILLSIPIIVFARGYFLYLVIVFIYNEIF